MCVGIPMQVIEVHESGALCEGMGERCLIDTMLVGEPPVGTWLMTFMGTAREVLTEAEARRITDAVTAVRQVMQGDLDIDHLFADLIDREPQLPPSAPSVASPGAASANPTPRDD